MRSRIRKLDEEKRKNLLDAAMDEISVNGLEGASYNRIIERSGLSKGVVYYYFENKESLYLTVLHEVERRFLTAVGKMRIPESPGEFWPVCAAYYEGAMRFAASNLKTVNVVRRLLGPPLDVRQGDSASRPFRRVDRWMDRLLKRGQELGVIRGDVPRDLLRNIIHMTGHVMDSWLFDHLGENSGSVKIEEFLAFAMDMYRRMLSPEGTGGRLC